VVIRPELRKALIRHLTTAGVASVHATHANEKRELKALAREIRRYLAWHST
jgi:hypothetical protein